MSKSTENIGLGILYLDPAYPASDYMDWEDDTPIDTMILLSKPHLKKHSLTNEIYPFDFYRGDSDREAKEHINKGLIEFKPMIEFRVLEQKSDKFKILLNEETKEFIWIDLEGKLDLLTSEYLKENGFDPNFVSDSIENWYFFEDWATYFKHSTLLNSDELIFYDKPNGKIIEKFNRVWIDSISKDWAKVMDLNDKEAWIRWHNNDSILIRFQRFIYY